MKAGFLAATAAAALIAGAAQAQDAPTQGPAPATPTQGVTTPDPAAGPARSNLGVDAAPGIQTGVAEIVVTAQKRSENIQSVPIAISAFTAKSLQERSIGNVSAIANITPNVTLDAGTPFSGSTAVLAAFIRGIGSDDFAFNIDPGVGIYLDGVYLARSVGANQDLLDVERVEVLKGPQGTLFGRNTIGGAISIVTRNPGDTFRVVGDFTTGSFHLLQGRASVDVPLTDSLTGNVTFGIKSRQGYLKRIRYDAQEVGNTTSYQGFAAAGYDANDHEGGDNDRTMRAKLRFNDGGRLRLTLTGDYTNNDDTGLPNKLLATLSTLPGNFAGTTNLPGTAFDPSGITGFNFAGLYNFCIGASPAQIAARGAGALCGARGTQYRPNLVLPGFGSANVDNNPSNNLLPFDNRFLVKDKDKSYATGNDFSKLESWGLAGTAEFDLAPNALLKSITAYRRLNWRAGTDVDGSPLNILQLSFPEHQHQFSQEVQLVGNLLDHKLNYVLGGYYFREAGTLHDYVTFDEGILQVDGPNRFVTRNYAFFGQLDYRPVDLVSFTVGGRYTNERKAFTGGQQDLNGFNYKLFGCSDANGNITPNAPFPLAPAITCQQGLGYPNPANPIQVYPPGLNKLGFHDFSPKLGVQLHPADRVLAYASWSKEYKTGG